MRSGVELVRGGRHDDCSSYLDFVEVHQAEELQRIIRASHQDH